MKIDRRKTRRKWSVRINYALGKMLRAKITFRLEKAFYRIFFPHFKEDILSKSPNFESHENLSRYQKKKTCSHPPQAVYPFFDHLHFRPKLKFNPTEIHYLFRFAAFNFGLFSVAMTICRLMRSNLLKTN